MGRHAGRAGSSRSQSTLVSGGAGRGAAVLTNPDGLPLDVEELAELRFSSGHRMTPVFGIGMATRRAPHDLPPIGSPEHTALLSGEIDLAAIELAADDRRPLVGFTPIVLDPAGPDRQDLDDLCEPAPVLPSSTRQTDGRLPSRRALRTGRRPSLPGPTASPDSGAAPRQQRPPVRRAKPAPPVVAGPPTAGLRIQEVTQALATTLVPPRGFDDPTPTGELARPFVDETVVGGPGVLDDVPPPVSVDVFQQAVRAGLHPDEAAAILAADPNAALDAKPSARAQEIPGSLRGGRVRTRREVRARERALTSPKGVAARRLAKGGVLAITALGVVSSANPQTLGAFGLDQDSLTTTRAFPGLAQALTPNLEVPALSAQGAQAAHAEQLSVKLRAELADAAADDAVSAGLGMGGAVAEWAKQHDAEAEARHQAALAAAAREAARDPKAYARQLLADRGWGQAQFQCLDSIWTRESNWNYKAVNSSSGAYGIAQALPGSKMSVFGNDWRTNPITQMKWGVDYIADRYGTPCNAWAFWQAHNYY